MLPGRRLAAGLALCCVVSCCVSGQAQDASVPLRGPYLGQRPPGLAPSLFAPGVVSTEADEVNGVFTPDGTEFYFASFVPGRGYALMLMSEESGGWTPRRAAPFSSAHSEVDPFITADGRQCFFLSRRPLQDGGPRSTGYQIWMTERGRQGWAPPRHLGGVVNFGSRHLFPTVSRNGTLYFNAGERGHGAGDLFRSLNRDGRFGEPENLGSAINTEFDETDGLIAPDESFIIFTSVGRPEGHGGGDLYISFRGRDGAWTQAVNMGRTINTDASEFAPALSPDGKYLFFTSGRRGNDDIYWVDAAIVDTYRPQAGEER